MTEKYISYGQQPLESEVEAVQRLRESLSFLRFKEDESEDIDVFGLALRQQQDGTYTGLFTTVFNSEYFTEVPLEDDNHSLFEIAEQIIRQDPALMRMITYADGRWWQYHPQLEPAVDNKLREVFEVRGDASQLDILNCSSEDLSEKEKMSIHYALNSVSAFTGEKALDRINGIILVDEEDLPEVSEKNIAFYNTPAGIIGVNMSYIRRTMNAMENRYEGYFPNSDKVDGLAVSIAHEFGHVMDVQTLREAEGYGLSKEDIWWSGVGDKTNSFSYFQESLGWNSQIMPDEAGNNHTVWNFDRTADESPPTDYAQKNPQEDFAETFSILALGGNLKSPKREQLMKAAFSNAEGEVAMGPHLVRMSKLDPSTKYSSSGRLKGQLRLRLTLAKI